MQLLRLADGCCARFSFLSGQVHGFTHHRRSVEWGRRTSADWCFIAFYALALSSSAWLCGAPGAAGVKLMISDSIIFSVAQTAIWHKRASFGYTACSVHAHTKSRFYSCPIVFRCSFVRSPVFQVEAIGGKNQYTIVYTDRPSLPVGGGSRREKYWPSFALGGLPVASFDKLSLRLHAYCPGTFLQCWILAQLSELENPRSFFCKGGSN